MIFFILSVLTMATSGHIILNRFIIAGDTATFNCHIKEDVPAVTWLAGSDHVTIATCHWNETECRETDLILHPGLQNSYKARRNGTISTLTIGDLTSSPTAVQQEYHCKTDGDIHSFNLLGEFDKKSDSDFGTGMEITANIPPKVIALGCVLAAFILTLSLGLGTIPLVASIYYKKRIDRRHLQVQDTTSLLSWDAN